MPQDMPERISEYMPDRVPERMSEDMPDRMPDRMSERMSEDMPDRMSEDMPDRMSWWGPFEVKYYFLQRSFEPRLGSIACVQEGALPTYKLGCQHLPTVCLGYSMSSRKPCLPSICSICTSILRNK